MKQLTIREAADFLLRNDKSGNPGANIRAGAEKHFPRARV